MNDPLAVIRAIHFAATLALAGAIIFGAAVSGPVLPGAEGEVLRRRLQRIAWGSFAVALLSGAAWLVLLAAQMGGRSLAEVLADRILSTVLLHTTFGHDWLVRLVLAALLAAALGFISAKHAPWPRWTIAALPAAAFAAALVHSGHPAATEGWLGTFHRAADGLHLIAASAWLGGLLPLALLLTLAGREEISPSAAREATARFSILGVLSVGTLLVTGIVNSWVLAGSVPALIGTDYGRLLLAKVALFAVMVAIAAVNRLYLTPRLAADRTAFQALARNSLIEATIGLAILIIVGALGTTPPGLHSQPTWPFAVRFSDAAFGDPDLGPKLVRALWAMGGGALLGGALIVVGIVVRRRRWWLIAAGGVIAGVCIADVAPTLGLLTVEAFPTSFQASPGGYAASSIVRGADLFATHCASCHGRRGRGDGPAGRFFRVKPPDLTADHVYGHTDGDIYWWISNGIREVMPAFDAVMDEAARWDVIDFVRANADAARLGSAPAKVTNVGYRSPDFSAQCPDGSIVVRDQMRGRIAHLIVAGRDAAERMRKLAAPGRDVITIAVAVEAVATADACRAADVNLAKALAMLAGKDAGAGEGTEFLVDASGALRAAWSAGGKPDWRDADVLQSEIAAVRANPAATRTTGSHLHAR
jgi:putative copper export protein/mono/diheme cytochrome c family protein